MLVVRGRWKAFGRGSVRFIRPQNRKVLAYLREFESETILCIANVSRTAQAVELDLSEFAGRTPVELSGEVAFPKIGQLTYLLTLQPFGFYWFSLSESADQPAWSTASSENIAEYHTFIIRDGLRNILDGRQQLILEKEVLPPYVAQRRWYQGKSAGIPAVRIADTQSFDNDLMFAILDVNGEHYTLPFAAAWDDKPSDPTTSLPIRSRRRWRWRACGAHRA
jgi:maltose alpha-D-glucosyltransferase/alpha-amylase